MSSPKKIAHKYQRFWGFLFIIENTPFWLFIMITHHTIITLLVHYYYTIITQVRIKISPSATTHVFQGIDLVAVRFGYSHKYAMFFGFDINCELHLGAPQGKRVIIMIDDLNMPKLDTYGSQPPIELLRQFLDFAGLYDREKMFWKGIQVN